jgi:Ser/Thr protein kinase RdoA (MazF antagonist)
MPDPVAPRLLAADSDLLVMEELPMGRSLADSLLGTDEALATADLIAFAEALARVHVWSSGRDDLPAAAAQPWWAAAVERGRGPFLELFARFGIAAPEVDAVIDDVLDEVRGGGYPSFVHGDPCPDNVRIVDGRARIFDFEMSSIGSMALDATYLLAPFPSCWCFASLPAAVSGAARLAYEQMVSTAGVNLAARWQRAVTAALAAAVVAHGTVITTALDDDKRWGTTTMRPRLLQWMSALAQAAGTEFAPLVSAVTELQHHLRALWPDIVVPEYPAFARVGRTRVEAPEWWGSQS